MKQIILLQVLNSKSLLTMRNCNGNIYKIIISTETTILLGFPLDIQELHIVEIVFAVTTSQELE